jgi:hypothetical protein
MLFCKRNLTEPPSFTGSPNTLYDQSHSPGCQIKLCSYSRSERLVEASNSLLGEHQHSHQRIAQTMMRTCECNDATLMPM